MNVTRMLKRELSRTSATPRQPAEADPFAQAIGRQLEQRGIVNATGPQAEAEPEWYDRVIALGQMRQRQEREWEARRQAEAQTETAPQSPAAAFAAAIGGTSVPLALNGAGVLRAALAGGHGTVNGGE